MIDLRRFWASFVAMLFAALALATPASAHLTPNSEIRLFLEPGTLRAEVLIPAGEFEFATGFQATDAARTRAYLLDHVAVATPAGAQWGERVDSLSVVDAPGGPDVLATLHFTAPPDAPDRHLVFDWDAVMHATSTHFALLSIDGDMARGQAHTSDLLGSLTAGNPRMIVDRGKAGHGDLFFGTIQLGAHHILIGYDHLLFLLALLLPAPLIASTARWAQPRPPRDTVRGLAWIVTAFTVGHSLTLVAAAAFSVRLPAAPVEIAIALSVLISAIHALRPIFPGREAWVALGFGLVHGLAFATLIAGFGTDWITRTVAILGFNLGIELIQLGIVILLLPALLIASRTRWYSPARTGLAAFAALAALAWLAERISDRPNPIAAWFELALPPLGLALIAISLIVGAVWLVRRKTISPVADETCPA